MSATHIHVEITETLSEMVEYIREVESFSTTTSLVHDLIRVRCQKLQRKARQQALSDRRSELKAP